MGDVTLIQALWCALPQNYKIYIADV